MARFTLPGADNFHVCLPVGLRGNPPSEMLALEMHWCRCSTRSRNTVA